MRSWRAATRPPTATSRRWTDGGVNGPADYALIFAIILLANTASSLTGFGGTVLALPFVAMLIGVKTAVPVLVVQAWVLAVFI